MLKISSVIFSHALLSINKNIYIKKKANNLQDSNYVEINRRYTIQ